MAKRPLQWVIKAGLPLESQLIPIIKVLKKGLLAGDALLTAGRPSKSRMQEEKYHAMIGDIAKQCKVDGKTYDRDIWKALLVDDYEADLNSQGEQLTHRSRIVMSLDGQRAISIRASTAKFRKAEGSGFIEFLYAFGAERKVIWSESALLVLAEYNVR